MNNITRVISNLEFVKEVDAVEAIKTNYRRAIQERLHDLTALKLSCGGKSKTATNSYPKSKVSHGIPENIIVFDTATLMSKLDIDNEFDFWNALLRGISNPIMDRLNIDRICDENDIPVLSEKILSKIRSAYNESKERDDDLSVFLEKILREKWFGESNKTVEDLLGAFYHCDNIRIELYAQVIAYYSYVLGVSSGCLAFVVLTHELAHAYTMAGYDINSCRGELLCSYYDKYIIEGLAQYYTEAVCKQLEISLPGVSDTFLKLRDGQRAPYKDYQNWLGSGSFDHERFRKDLMVFRGSVKSFDPALW
ncbi:MAG: hypothetical protein CVU50_07975 [Candidatus Cloacimonetes bacterium HGW-Cloacimonetes-3]|jgi:hypothetical protein|nr:MAG: hypothetical protein CVU50_07975 [Candidatus Cloacimonetes bacterium HGW-Cloacimonetes-3]